MFSFSKLYLSFSAPLALEIKLWAMQLSKISLVKYSSGQVKHRQMCNTASRAGHSKDRRSRAIPGGGDHQGPVP